MDSLERRAHRAITGRIGRLGLSAHPGLLFSINSEGYKNYAFGARTGPSIAVSNVFHELAHAAEFGPDEFEARASAEDYRFKLPEVWVYDRICIEPATTQAILRELRTFAHQYHLMRLAGYRLDKRSFARQSAQLMQFMPDWLCIPERGDTARTRYCSSRIGTYIKAYHAEDSFERLRGWLDRVPARLNRPADPNSVLSRKKAPSAFRFRADGSPYDIR